MAVWELGSWGPDPLSWGLTLVVAMVDWLLSPLPISASESGMVVEMHLHLAPEQDWLCAAPISAVVELRIADELALHTPEAA